MAPPQLQTMALDAMAAKVAGAAAELGLGDLLAEGPATSAELARRAGAQAPHLRRLLLALAALGVVEQTGADRFALAEAGGPLASDHPASVRALLAMLCGPEVWRAWEELVPVLRTGERGWDRAHGVPTFDYYARHPDAGALFNDAMAAETRLAAPELIDRIDPSRFATVVDVGGGSGGLLARMLAWHPHLRGVLFDLPAGLAGAEETLAAAGVDERARIVAGDAFEGVPAGGDAYLLKQVLHDWDDARAAPLLRRCREAMREGARLFVLERVLPERAAPEAAPAYLVDVLMMTVTGGGERTAREFAALLGAAGFETAAVSEPLQPLGYSVIEGVAARALPGQPWAPARQEPAGAG